MSADGQRTTSLTNIAESFNRLRRSTSVTDRQKTGRQTGDSIALVAQDDRGVGRFDRAHTSFYSILPYLLPFGGCSEMLVEDSKFHPT